MGICNLSQSIFFNVFDAWTATNRDGCGLIGQFNRESDQRSFVNESDSAAMQLRKAAGDTAYLGSPTIRVCVFVNSVVIEYDNVAVGNCI